MTSAEARFSNSLRPRKPEGSLGRTAQDGHLDSHTAPELCPNTKGRVSEKVVLIKRGCRCLVNDSLVWKHEGKDLIIIIITALM